VTVVAVVAVVAVVDGFPGVLMPPESPVEPGALVLEVPASVSEDVSPSPASQAGTRRTKEAKEIQRRCMAELQATPCLEKTFRTVG